jgi:DNA-binding GntR family transcriptional regulator
MNDVRTVGERVYDEVRDKILSGELGAGMRLVQRKLASELGTSIIPISEALRRLESEGLVICQAGLGAQVKVWTPDDVTGIHLLREYLEAATSRLFAEKASPAECLALKELGERYDRCLAEKDPMPLIRADIDLHLYIAKHSKSPTLAQFAENFCVITIAMKNALWRSKKPAPGPQREPGIHDELIAAVASGDPDRAEQAARGHVRKAALDVFLRHMGSDVLKAEPEEGRLSEKQCCAS